MGIFGTLFGGGYGFFSPDPIQIDPRQDASKKIKIFLPSKFRILTFEYLYDICFDMSNKEIEKNLVVTEEAINYLESKERDVGTLWKVCAAFLGIFIPVSAFISFSSISILLHVSENVLKIFFCLLILSLYIIYFLLFVAFLNIQHIKMHNYKLYRRVLLHIKEKHPRVKEFNREQVTPISDGEKVVEDFIIDVIYNPSMYNYPLGCKNGRISVDELVKYVRENDFELSYRMVVEAIINSNELRFNTSQTVIILPDNLLSVYNNRE
ncbi:MAG: hypothetical protein HDR19_03165 [Lachnospiraceae bacterium]|nr:hypothetical protein [Lachnospiraceae bacterium]